MSKECETLRKKPLVAKKLPSSEEAAVADFIRLGGSIEYAYNTEDSVIPLISLLITECQG